MQLEVTLGMVEMEKMVPMAVRLNVDMDIVRQVVLMVLMDEAVAVVVGLVVVVVEAQVRV